jgi:hypothetical protein
MSVASKTPKVKKRVGSYVVTKPTSVALRLVKPYIVDKTIRWGRANDYCDVVDEALTVVFGPAPKTGWRDSDGYDVEGFDVDGYDPDGYDDKGFGADGYNVSGCDSDGFNRDRLNWRGQHKDSVELLAARWSNEYAVQVRDCLLGRTDLPPAPVVSPSDVQE